MKTHFIYRTRRISREETLHVNEHGRPILCMDRRQHSNDILGLETTRLLGTLHRLNCAIHIMTNLVSITQSANLMTSSGLRGGVVTQRTDTKLPDAYRVYLKAAWSGAACDDSVRSWHANCTSKEHKYYIMTPPTVLVWRTGSQRPDSFRKHCFYQRRTGCNPG